MTSSWMSSTALLKRINPDTDSDRMKRVSSFLIAAVLAVGLSACSNSTAEEKKDKETYLKAVDEAKQKRQEDARNNPKIAGPILNLKEDLSTAKGAITAYYAYLYYGDSTAACGVLAPQALTAMGGEEECYSITEGIAMTTRSTFESSLPITRDLDAQAKENGNTATGSASIMVNQATGQVYADTFKLAKIDGQWRITSMGSLIPQESIQ